MSIFPLLRVKQIMSIILIKFIVQFAKILYLIINSIPDTLNKLKIYENFIHIDLVQISFI
jgi:hypothetical protein